MKSYSPRERAQYKTRIPAMPDTPPRTKIDELLSQRTDTPSRGIPAVWGGSNGRHPRWVSSGTKSETCYRVLPDGSRIPFVSEKAQKRQKRTSVTVQHDQARKLIQSIKLDHDYNEQ